MLLRGGRGHLSGRHHGSGMAGRAPQSGWYRGGVARAVWRRPLRRRVVAVRRQRLAHCAPSGVPPRVLSGAHEAWVRALGAHRAQYCAPGPQRPGRRAAPRSARPPHGRVLPGRPGWRAVHEHHEGGHRIRHEGHRRESVVRVGDPDRRGRLGPGPHPAQRPAQNQRHCQRHGLQRVVARARHIPAVRRVPKLQHRLAGALDG
mmetsp:Transcript_7141/g.11202  ORF Transcript_7141/g.11202 Transcript_7141/m.11202 type:complete len:203 (+) Transcript_7141:325-933(+)